MNATADVELWATQQVAFAVLNDVRNVERTRLMLADLARTPDPCLAEVFADGADEQAAYDFVENARIDPRALASAFACAAACAAAGTPRLFVPIDASHLSIPDPGGRKGLGSVGSRSEGGRGLKFYDALAVGEDGVPLGLLALHVWSRTLQRPAWSHKRRRPEDKESRYWNEVRSQARRALDRFCPDTQVCYLMDADADNWAVLLEAVAAAHDSGGREQFIVRAAQDRRVVEGHPDAAQWAALRPPFEHLQGLLQFQPARTFTLSVPEGHGRSARQARMELTFAPVTLDLLCVPGGGRAPAPLWAVRAREVGPVPEGEERLDWTLLTTMEVTSFEQAERVCREYGHRWRCEDFHKQLKGGGQQVERTQLRSAGAIERWLMLHAAVAMRTLRITYLARVRPEAPATDVLSARELEALRLLRARHGRETPARLTAGALLPMLASLGGYAGNGRRPPGPKVLGRALRRLAMAADGIALRDLADHRKQRHK
jgi:Transposase DNA-binding